jgi:hypothetical protein
MEYKFYNKVHYPNCGCRYNNKNIYLVDVLDKTTGKYSRYFYYNRLTLNFFLKKINYYYSVCIHHKTPISKLNGGVIFIVPSILSSKYKENFKPNDEISTINFYIYKKLSESVDNFTEYPKFKPIQKSLSILSMVDGKDLEILICTEKYGGIHSFPKGKRMLDESSIECVRREFKEETGIKLQDSIFSKLYQNSQRELLNITNLPHTIVIYNCLFQIILQNAD